ncbi:hypothetical protein [Pedobacter sp. ok626]|uniref:hypothetical protein n=1 Tax=Pedobacter sp. ok626 TaxID=1761882 RepID=UPI001047DA53|nr:hypothetical protein [Pedobacter sp. ok626]
MRQKILRIRCSVVCLPEEKASVYNLDIIHEEVVFNIWQEDNGFIELKHARQDGDPTLKTFAQSLPDNFVIADLRNQSNQNGFSWGKLGQILTM